MTSYSNESDGGWVREERKDRRNVRRGRHLPGTIFPTAFVISAPYVRMCE